MKAKIATARCKTSIRINISLPGSQFDENGWYSAILQPLLPGESYSLLSPDISSRVDAERWSAQAKAFFRTELVVESPKQYPSGIFPISDRIDLRVGRLGSDQFTRICVFTFPIERAPGVRERALLGVAAIGGAGFDVLVGRTKRVWQISDQIEDGGDALAALAAAALLSMLWLAPIVPPREITIFGVKGARTRLEAAGWRT